jgi:hypothetical protein
MRLSLGQRSESRPRTPVTARDPVAYTHRDQDDSWAGLAAGRFRGHGLRFASQRQGCSRGDRGSQRDKRFLASTRGHRDHGRDDCVRRAKNARGPVREGLLRRAILLGLSRRSAWDVARCFGLLHGQERESRAHLDRRAFMTNPSAGIARSDPRPVVGQPPCPPDGRAG